MSRVAVLGANGRMGRRVVSLVRADPALTLVAAVTHATDAALGDTAEVPLVAVGPGCFGDAEVVVDFSLPGGVAAALDHLGTRALVSGTTGLDLQTEARRTAHAKRAPLLVAANFSAGIHLLHALVARASAALPHASIEIVETHHRHKRDAPSGTALFLAQAAADPRRVDPATIPTHALRGGDVVGDHTVWLLADGERIALSHSATSRDTFAHGAVRAAAWIAGRPPGAYRMVDVLAGTI